ncbi:MAG TPA: branched-chain amino acid ABC transporter substrate-binding protein [Actinomycetota bacterium]|nr:branched-chain amino acid ABC transporter substrate-binding protein [Actinomycetota bacterium]
MRNRRFFALLALFAVLTLVAAACSNDDGGGGTETGGGGETGTQTGGAVDCESDEFGCVEIAAGEPITLGTLQAISGDTASLGTDQVNGVMLAIDYLDGTLDGTNGQLLGHDVEIVQEDDLCSAEGGQQGATALAANEAIVAVVGTSCSSAALGVADQIFSDKGILLISSSNTNPGLTSEEAHQPFYLRTAHNDKIQGAIVADFALQELGATTAATINDESPYADGLAAAFRDWFTANGGEIVGQEAIQSTDTDFQPLLTSLADAAPDVLYFPDFNPACALIAQQAREIMPDTELIGSDGCLATDFLETAGDAAEGVYASSPDLSTFAGGEAYQDLIRQYNETFGQAPPSVFHAHAFDAANILFDAIESVAQDDGGNLTIPRTALKDAIFATNGYQGITGTISCTPLGDCATDVTIGIFEAPDWPVEGGNPDAAAVYSDTKTLEEVSV